MKIVNTGLSKGCTYRMYIFQKEKKTTSIEEYIKYCVEKIDVDYKTRTGRKPKIIIFPLEFNVGVVECCDIKLRYISGVVYPGVYVTHEVER